MARDQDKQLQKTTEDLVLIEDDSLLSIKEVHEISNQPEAFRRYQNTLKKNFFSTLLFALTHEKYAEENARDLWDAIVDHRNHLNQKLERDVGIGVAALDYMSNIAQKITSPKIIGEAKTHQIAEFATRDESTGLYVRGIFDVSMERHIKESLRYKNPLSLMMIDIDDFKNVNDSHGHLLGDKVLKQIGRIIMANIRDSDLAARYGGEELAVILPQTELKGAHTIAERIRKGVFDYYKKDLDVTVSIGLSELKKEVETSRILIEYADQALYAAKSSGKNKVAVYEHHLSVGS